jgi:hypothetical protein
MLISLRTAVVVALGLMATACKKETETVIVEVEKQVSWKEAKGLSGISRVVLSSGSDGNSLFLQSPFFFSDFNKQTGNNRSYALGLPTDIRVRIAVAPTFLAYPLNDTLLSVCRTADPLNSPMAATVRLRQLDPSAIRFNTNFLRLFKCTAINRNNYLLVSYLNNASAPAYTFLLTAVTPGRPGRDVLGVQSRVVSIPCATWSNRSVRHIAAVENYFLVEIDEGIFKIREDGSFRKVASQTIVDAFYKWKGVVYAPVEYNKILSSTDDGETWQLSTNTPDHFTLANYYTVRDSLVGVYGSNLYTLRWNGQQYHTRFLRNDGLERADINGLEVLRDTVYIATSNGLYARPVSKFFELKTQ